MRAIRENLKWGDWLLIFFLCACIIISLLCFYLVSPRGRTLVVVFENREVHRMSLDQDGEFDVSGPLGHTVIRVEDGRARIVEAPCPHKTCMRMGSIRHSGDLIICLPNRVLLRIEGKDRRRLDGITM